MKRYRIKIFTTCNDLLVETIMDEFALNEVLDGLNSEYLIVEDDTEDKYFYLKVSQIVGIEVDEI